MENAKTVLPLAANAKRIGRVEKPASRRQARACWPQLSVDRKSRMPASIASIAPIPFPRRLARSNEKLATNRTQGAFKSSVPDRRSLATFDLIFRSSNNCRVQSSPSNLMLQFDSSVLGPDWKIWTAPLISIRLARTLLWYLDLVMSLIYRENGILAGLRLNYIIIAHF